MSSRLSLFFPLVLLACTAPVPHVAQPVVEQPQPVTSDPRLQVKLLYVLEDGGVFRYDEIATAPERRNLFEVRGEADATFTRYSFTLHDEGPGHWWTSL